MKNKQQNNFNSEAEVTATPKKDVRTNQSYFFSSEARQKAANKGSDLKLGDASDQLLLNANLEQKEANIEFHIYSGWAGLIPQDQENS